MNERWEAAANRKAWAVPAPVLRAQAVQVAMGVVAVAAGVVGLVGLGA